MIRNLNDLLIFENSCINNNLILILGSDIDELHVRNFAQKQRQNTTIWCISRDSVPREDFDNNIVYKQFNFDFNIKERWITISEIIKQNYILKKIIVDWSTAKFFDDGFNFYRGGIMKIIRNFIDIHNTEFYSPCCYNSVYFHNDEFGSPNFFKYITPEISEYPKQFIRKNRFLINTDFIKDFNNFIENYMDNKYIVTYYSESNGQSFIKYPLERIGNKKIKDYIIIKKNI